MQAFIECAVCGLGQPWVKVRTLTYYFRHLFIKGNEKFRDCVQMIGKRDEMGDEIGGLLEIDEMFGL